jgi:hypothetical protein
MLFFENNVFVHLSQTAVQAAREAYRVLKPRGFFAARDADVDSVVWGHFDESLKQLDKLFAAWPEAGEVIFPSANDSRRFCARRGLVAPSRAYPLIPRVTLKLYDLMHRSRVPCSMVLSGKHHRQRVG